MKRFLVLLVTLLLAVTPALADGVNPGDVGEVISRTASLRVDPSTSAELIVSIKNGESFSIIGENDNWYQVVFNDQTGWIRKRYVVENPIHLVARSDGDLFASPSVTDKMVGSYSRYDRFTVIEETSRYYLVSCRNAAAYISRNGDFWTDEDLAFLNNVQEIRLTSGKTPLYLTASTRIRVATVGADTALEVAGYVDDYAIVKYLTGYAYVPVDNLR